MSDSRYKLANIRVLIINGLIVIAPVKTPVADIKKWFEKTEGLEVESLRLVSFSDKIPESGGAVDYAAHIREQQFEAAHLPLILEGYRRAATSWF